MSSPGAKLAAMREQVKKECLECGTTFQAITIAKYCSEACKQRAKYNRKKEAERAARWEAEHNE